MANAPPNKEVEDSIERNVTTELCGSVSEINAKAVGFDCDFVTKPPQSVQCECPLCLQKLREPYQAPCCGNSFCRVCIERIKADNKPCPTCKEENFVTYHNKGLQRSLYEFQVYCSYKQEGCEWKGELGQLDNHLNLTPQPDKLLEGCAYSSIECKFCKNSQKRRDIGVHQLEQCPKRPFTCEYCHNYESCYEDVVNHCHTDCEAAQRPLLVTANVQIINRTDNVAIPRLEESQRVNNQSLDVPSEERNNLQLPGQPQQGQQHNAQDNDQAQHNHIDEQPDQNQDRDQDQNQDQNQDQDQDQDQNQDQDQDQDQNQNQDQDQGQDQNQDQDQVPPPQPQQAKSKLKTIAVILCSVALLPILGVALNYYFNADKCTLLPALLQKCDHHCNSTTFWFKCYCDTGYRLSSGYSCNDINECKEGKHSCTQVCINTLGSYRCKCLSGYTLNKNGITCNDIDECAEGTHQCAHDCHNTIGSYDCSCRRGYSLIEDGRNCSDIDECASDSHGCDQMCTNTDGSYECWCDKGYLLDADGHTCEDINECAKGLHPCKVGCENTIGSYVCTCDPGYKLMEDKISCTDIDECEDETHECEHLCTNTEGSYTCRCYPNGHFYLNEDGRHCDGWLKHLKSYPEMMKEHWFQEEWDNITGLDILLTGKTGTGKSTLINGLLGKKVIPTKENSLHADTAGVTGYTLKAHGVQMRIWDSPGLQDRSGREADYIAGIKSQCHSIDLVFYCIRMDENRLGDDDKAAILKLKEAFTKRFWDNTFFVLTFANRVTPPRARKRDPEEYFSDRLGAWVELIQELLMYADVTMDVETLRKRVIPAGFEDPHLPDRRYWLSKLWHNVLEEAEEKAHGAMLKLGLERMINETMAEKFAFSEHDIDEQPIVSGGTWWQSLREWAVSIL